jgi:hypothetical protein
MEIAGVDEPEAQAAQGSGWNVKTAVVMAKKGLSYKKRRICCRKITVFTKGSWLILAPNNRTENSLGKKRNAALYARQTEITLR